MPQGGQVLGVLDLCANGLGETTEKLVAGGQELIATKESPVLAKTLFDPIVMEGSQGDGCLSNPSGTNQSDRREALRKVDNLLD